MIKFAFAAVVLGLFVLIFIGKKLAAGTKEAWSKANAMTNAKLGSDRNSLSTGRSPTEAQDHSFTTFMEAQSALLNLDGMGLILDSELEKQLYVHFMAGAADRLSRTIPDQADSERWFLLSAHSYASTACGERAAVEILHSYGRSDNLQLCAAGKAGWDSMSAYIGLSSGKVTEEQFKLMMMYLFAVVRQKELPVA
ncbi:hypothetical protein DYI22_15675 [Marinobacter lipolyticus]|uniref:hypothetical protein n=1 Tax=Marinobacter lipolyticus TaxID=209639 RepID=UPI001BCEEF2C|nr:hypothetical protein [Marinobacter lipolyticus]MBS8241928.1 hypothetical protein [Marinobacter lipolyticus]